MTSLAELIETFRRGALSHDAFIMQIDRTLALDHANCARLREPHAEQPHRQPLFLTERRWRPGDGEDALT